MTHFNKRHYQDIALAIQAARVNAVTGEPVNSAEAIIEELTLLFARDNRLFKRDLFLQACRPGQNVRARKVA